MTRDTLGRIHRVRSLQLTLARADEARAHAQVASEAAMSARIAQLAAAVAPMSGGAATVLAQSHYRERLHKSAQVAADRLAMAEAEADRAVEGARAAKRDQSAVEKLLERARLEALRREARSLEDQPHHKKRHGPC